MDTPRRWQVASIATAVAGLGLGSLLVGRSPSIEVAPIDLDAVSSATATEERSLDRPIPDPAEIVTPQVREHRIAPATDPTFGSLPGADAPASSTSREGSGELTGTTPATPRTRSDAPATSGSADNPAPADSSDSASSPAPADSLDSASSLDSVSG